MSKPGRHFLHIPGPTNVPDRVLRAMDRALIDHRGPEFAQLTLRLLPRLQKLFKCSGPVVIYPASGTGAWEAALVNTLSPGDKVLMADIGHFASLWKDMADRLGLEAEFLPSDWRRAADPEAIRDRLAADTGHEIKAVCVVHNETSTGCAARLPEIRRAIDDVGHPALFMVDTISSLGSMDYRHDEWKVDVSVGGSQKGMMLPPGMSFNAISQKALDASKTARLPKCYWEWNDMLSANQNGFFPYTPATNLFYALDEALTIIEEQGLDNIIARHERHAEATRRAVHAWGLELVCADPREYSSSLTSIFVPEGYSANALRAQILENFDLSLGTGLARLADRVFRIGHLGDLNDLTLIGAISGVEMGLKIAGIPHNAGGTQAAMDFLAGAEQAEETAPQQAAMA
ncbi:pyridoxal-phosphate-dependent aminotransferase family protein [Dichotomicrobium thermohalophilum]|uniref:Alanine-glyoxylate transaminase/serine-glyoxylate transaminase/serine-pyruvate transaminase n=1 Tax=Dichotomicrobium thermohalophilum TaxID=933063 RepID=A0A397PFI2_9HYPH|nr:aminotransferase class V-fold PLP-dependent enzyme [Dichotomicrobium thermohalophilum]RIA47718.1 alanine-glyoxylate transaminase/serine-glyoxylate transaminase/serine-pyruvate transaminase [Dichotomicrobium thermohalophilum]